ncbi:uncharacterized protein SCODWIG_02241 [Saccharomycodes ludwigii]|uniref:HDA1 complex subunit 3 n=1 Tax=Saccharomycodes ludwigii TaxID=36035 RepID=A0A376B8M9_9ASCO|nr:hypothetical protein SCDLUD_000025 [Saccharomycodes ludwigii]KAH3902448.1 hypothetical protein SCDLUD_000025 [Saccharomycodes ludwigii]SSD60480.1 uncharacterized protein SCODWIG_02241 [Saccharomycodes ludwigii]
MDLSKILDAEPEPNIILDLIKKNPTHFKSSSGVNTTYKGKQKKELTSINATNNNAFSNQDYWLPAPMCQYQCELTDQIVSLHYSDILKFFKCGISSSDVIRHSMNTMLENSKLVALHPYLLVTHQLPRSLITKDVPGHICQLSGEFQVLKDLIGLISKFETNTALCCNAKISEKCIDLIEALLLGSKVNIKRYDGKNSIKHNKKKSSSSSPPIQNNSASSTSGSNSNSSSNDVNSSSCNNISSSNCTSDNFSCTVHIFPTDAEEILCKKLELQYGTDFYFDILISLDSDLDLNKSVFFSKLLSLNRQIKAPVVRITTINSVDHASLYYRKLFNKDAEPERFLRDVVSATVILRDCVGVLPPDLKPVFTTNLQYLDEWVNQPSLPWPLPDIYPIREFSPIDIEGSLLTEVRHNGSYSSSSVSNNNHNTSKYTYAYDKRPDNLVTAKIHLNDNDKYYVNKRCKNDYSTNPLIRQNMSYLTGISNTDNKYYLNSKFLTHELITTISNTYKAIGIQNLKIKSFEKTNALENGHVKYYEDELAKITEKVNKTREKLETNKTDCNEYLREEEEIREKLHLYGKHKVPQHILLEEELTKLQKSLEAKKSEKVYISVELNRARELNKNNKEQISKLKHDLDIHRIKFQEQLKKDIQTQREVDEESKKLRQKIISLRGKNLKYHSKLEEINHIIREKPIERNIRSSSKRRRRRT